MKRHPRHPEEPHKKTPFSLPVAVAKQYSITRIGFSANSEFTRMNDLATFVPSFIMAENQGNSESIGVTIRWSRLAAVYAKAALLPAPLHGLLKRHQDYLASGQVVERTLTSIVQSISNELMSVPGYVADSDPLLMLERMLHIPPTSGPTLPPPDELGEDEPEVSVRAAHQYRMAKIRGAAGRRFSIDVRTAYRHRCAFCGARFSGISGIHSGVDAAHILAWSKHELDVVSNGIALCKLHHWAFDAGVIMPVKDGADYYVRFTELAHRLDSLSLERLGTDGQRISSEWLPEKLSDRPSALYLKHLHADLGLAFSDSL